mmetsp:Transcript_64738/g.186188  ORF Transcript_64738/g.186188 Transcript_64738/m.186188 type:complete len:243 (-) Transcript_64738:160-888(-)
MLAAAKATVALDADEDVEVQVLRAMSVHARLLPVILILEHPALADQVQEHQAVLVDVVEQVPEAGPDGHRHALHDAGAQVRRHTQREALQHASLLHLALQPLVAPEALQRELRLGAAAAPILATEEGGVRGVGLQAIEDVPQGILSSCKLLDDVEQAHRSLRNPGRRVHLARILAAVCEGADTAYRGTPRASIVLVRGPRRPAACSTDGAMRAANPLWLMARRPRRRVGSAGPFRTAWATAG